MPSDYGGSNLPFVLAGTLLHKAGVLSPTLPLPVDCEFAAPSRARVATQRPIQASDRLDFAPYRRRYLDRPNLSV